MKTMWKETGLMLALMGFVLAGCETPDGRPYHAGSGALIGAGVGAASGAIIGGRHAGQGALIGGAVGAVAGGLIGHSADQQEAARSRAQVQAPYTSADSRRELSLEEVKSLARAGLGDEVILSQIRSTRTVYRLSAADIVELHNAGVSQRVIDFMINTPATAGSVATAPPVVVAAPPPPPPAETVVVAPGPGYVWMGGEWQWRGRWVWVGGAWAMPPRPRAVWVRGGWVYEAPGWRYVPGHWG